MNFLQLGQLLASNCGAENVTLTTMQGQSGEALRFVNWVNQAWEEIQTLFDEWKWMRSSSILGAGVSFVPLSGFPSCPLGTGPGTVGIIQDNFGKWVLDSFRNFTTSVGNSNEIFMEEISFDWWRDSYMYGANRQVKTRPTAFAVGPDKSICVGPPSDGTYTVQGDYYVAPSLMSADTDTPTGLPKNYHMAIVYKGMTYYGAYEAAAEVTGRGLDGYLERISELTRTYGPSAFLAGSLA